MIKYKPFFILLITAFIYPINSYAEVIKKTGTFSSFHFNEESGDLGGVEIKIVVGLKGYQAAIQISEGAPSNIFVVDVEFQDNNISFQMPESSGFDAQFKGRLYKEELKGSFIFKNGNEWKINLPRRVSYWN